DEVARWSAVLLGEHFGVTEFGERFLLGGGGVRARRLLVLDHVADHGLQLIANSGSGADGEMARNGRDILSSQRRLGRGIRHGAPFVRSLRCPSGSAAFSDRPGVARLAPATCMSRMHVSYWHRPLG